MSDDIIPHPVAEFLATYISSLEELEVLILLSGSPGRAWKAEEAFAEIKSNQTSIENRLRSFAAAGLVTADAAAGTYRFSPPNDAVRQKVELTIEFYRKRPVRTIEAIFSRLADPAQTFANAFRIRRK